jgi:tRNA (guanine37-N1)-methyltransferase
MHFNILTLFPEMFPGPLGQSLAGKALEKGLWGYEAIQIRDFAQDKHKTVDDTPYGGGAGMVMKPDVLARSLDYAIEKQPKTKLIYPSPRGKLLTQAKIEEFVASKSLTILCGRYEGVDHRVLEKYGVEEVSIGDYILSGSEVAAIVIIDACIRKLDGVIGNSQTHSQESFGAGNFSDLLEYPHYTRPESWQGLEVPDVLKNGNHALIEKWRLEQAEKVTKERRPDLWNKHINKKG